MRRALATLMMSVLLASCGEDPCAKWDRLLYEEEMPGVLTEEWQAWKAEVDEAQEECMKQSRN